jgi:hypothetical protein
MDSCLCARKFSAKRLLDARIAQSKFAKACKPDYILSRLDDRSLGTRIAETGTQRFQARTSGKKEKDMKRTVSMLTAALFVGAIAMPAFAQAPAESPAAAASTAPSAEASPAAAPTEGMKMTHKHHRRHHHHKKTMEEGASPSAEPSMAPPMASPAASPAAS